TVERLVSKHRLQPHSALGSSGLILGGWHWGGVPFTSVHCHRSEAWNRVTDFDIGPCGRTIDILFGFSGALYLRRFFPDVDQLLSSALRDENVFLNDDVMISAYLAQQQIERWVYYDLPRVEAIRSPNIVEEDNAL